MTADTGDDLKPLCENQVQLLLKMLENDFPSSIFVYNWIKKQMEWASKLKSMKVLILCPDGDWTDGTVIGITYGLVVNWITTQMVWKAKCPEMKVKIFCPEGDWREEVVICLAEGAAASNKVFGVVHATEEKLGVLREALMTTDVIDWDRLTQISSCLKRYLPIFKEILREKGFKYSSDAILPCVVYYMPVESVVIAPLPELPENVRVGALDVSHLDTICDNWQSYEPQFRPVVVKNIELNSTVGVFLKNENGQETICSMVMQAEYGGVGVMQTLPEFRRKGFAALALAHLTRAFGNKGLNPYANAFVWNEKSISLFKKCGYKLLGETATVCIRNNKESS